MIRVPLMLITTQGKIILQIMAQCKNAQNLVIFPLRIMTNGQFRVLLISENSRELPRTPENSRELTANLPRITHYRELPRTYRELLITENSRELLITENSRELLITENSRELLITENSRELTANYYLPGTPENY